jgi:hypothetical protein
MLIICAPWCSRAELGVWTTFVTNQLVVLGCGITFLIDVLCCCAGNSRLLANRYNCGVPTAQLRRWYYRPSEQPKSMA